MTDSAMITTNCVVCGKSLEGQVLDHAVFAENPLKLVKLATGVACEKCGAFMCWQVHNKEIGWNAWSGWKNVKCLKCGESFNPGKMLLSGDSAVDVKGTIAETTTFEGTHKAAAAKHQKNAKIAFYVALISFLVFVIWSIAGNGEITGFLPMMSLLGIWALPYAFLQRGSARKTRKLLEKLPLPGQEQLDYVTQWYEKSGYERQPLSGDGQGKVRLQMKKPKFNILIAIVAFLFGIIGLFFYIQSLNQPRPIVELSLTDDGHVTVSQSQGQ